MIKAQRSNYRRLKMNDDGLEQHDFANDRQMNKTSENRGDDFRENGVEENGSDDFFSTSGRTDLLDGLNPAQQEAVRTTEGPLMILAGPGSGKTRVVTHRVAYMIQQGIRPDQIVALTFTNKAADELKNRIAGLVPGNYVWTGTFHRFCSRLLRQYAPLIGLSENFSIFDMDDAAKVLGNAWDLADIDDSFVSKNAVQNEISRAKNAIITAEEYRSRPGKPVGSVVEQVYPIYQRLLLECNAVDFDDLLTWTAILLQQHEDLRRSLDRQFAYIMVDEYQDTNLAQYAIVRALSNDSPNLAVTGDPDQSIYGWRGANIQNILGFERDYPEVKVVRLEQNYRSTKNILNVADQLIGHNTQRKAKRLLTDQSAGDAVRLMVFPSPQEEADFIAAEIAQACRDNIWDPKDIAIFYRANWLSRQLEHAFTGLGIPYQLVNGFEFYQRKEVKDIIAYLRIISNPRNDIAVERIINTPARKIGKVTVQRLKAYAAMKGISLLESCRVAGLQTDIAKRSATAVAGFVAQIDRISAIASNSVQEMIQHILQVTGYREVLEVEDTEQSMEKVANIDELISAAREFDNQHPEDGGLDAYLETSALASDTDKLVDGESAVKLMTIHAAKGLEFPCVYVVGLEEGIMPHERSRENISQVEEERRLLFVALTRAESQLTISRCESRIKRGQFWVSPPSSFLLELPTDEMEVFDRQRGRRQTSDPWNNDFQTESWVDDYCGGTSFDVNSFEDAADSRSSSRSNSASDGSDSNESGLDTSFDFGDSSNNQVEESLAAPSSPASSSAVPPSSTSPPPQNKTVKNKTAQDDLPKTGRGRKPGAPQGNTARNKPLIATAAAFFSENQSSPANDQDLTVGVMVEHPEYGVGTVDSISGPPKKQRVIVDFMSEGKKNFVLRFANLKKLQ